MTLENRSLQWWLSGDVSHAMAHIQLMRNLNPHQPNRLKAQRGAAAAASGES